MKVIRKDALAALRVAAIGATQREVLEQSNCLVFAGASVVAFSGEILTRGPSPLPGVEGAVPAEDLVALLAKIPDEEVDVSATEGELRIKGRRRAAGITMAAEARLPYAEVPEPGEWLPLRPATFAAMVQAARVCGKDESQPRTTEVHVSLGVVEACDNFRLYRAAAEGLDGELLIPASSVLALAGTAFTDYSTMGGWLHLRTAGGHVASARCSAGKYPDLRPLLVLEGARRVEFPDNLADIVARVEVMQDYDAMAQVSIVEGEISLKARKDGGWYSERRRIDYSGEPLRFEVNTQFLRDILAKTHVVRIAGNKLKIKSGDGSFVVCLEVEEKESWKKEETEKLRGAKIMRRAK